MLHYFVSEKGNDSSLLLLTPLTRLQVTSALPPVVYHCTVPVHWGRLRTCLGKKTHWLKTSFGRVVQPPPKSPLCIEGKLPLLCGKLKTW